MKNFTLLFIVLLYSITFLPSYGSDDKTNAPNDFSVESESTFPVDLTNIENGEVTTIEIPNGRPIYALLVSGFHQNSEFEQFHFYNFAKHLLEEGAYVHFAWWNNLLAPYMEKPLHDPNSLPRINHFNILFGLNSPPLAAKINNFVHDTKQIYS